MAFDPYPPKTQTQGPQAPGAPVASIFFDRKELSAILSLYGRMVAGGHWRDYGIDASREAVSFCVFRRASEAPLYRIEKRPALGRKQGAWAVIAQGGLVMKRAHELDQVLKVFDRARFAVVK